MKSLLINPDKLDLSILVVDDSPASRKEICSFLKRNYSHARIDAPENLFKEEKEEIENIIRSGQYTNILVKNDLMRWDAHPVFGQWAEKIISFVRNKFPKIIIVGMSKDNEEGYSMKDKGAHGFVIRSYLLNTALSVQFPLEFKKL